MNFENNEYVISTDQARINIPLVHGYLANESYWAKNIPYETVEKAIANSLCFGVYKTNEQVGFARVITDKATVAYLGDVFILPEHRGRELSKRLMEAIMGHPELQGLRRWILLTQDAHELYKKYGWKEIAEPARWMEWHNKNIYQKN